MVLHVCPVSHCPSSYDRFKLLKNHLHRAHAIDLDRALDAMMGRRAKKSKNATARRPARATVASPTTPMRPFANTKDSAIDLRTPSLSPSLPPIRAAHSTPNPTIALSPDSSPEFEIQTPREALRSAPTWAIATPEHSPAVQEHSEMQQGANQRVESDADDESSTLNEDEDDDGDFMIMDGNDHENEKGDPGEGRLDAWGYQQLDSRIVDSSTFYRDDTAASQVITPEPGDAIFDQETMTPGNTRIPASSYDSVGGGAGSGGTRPGMDMDELISDTEVSDSDMRFPESNKECDHMSGDRSDDPQPQNPSLPNHISTSLHSVTHNMYANQFHSLASSTTPSRRSFTSIDAAADAAAVTPSPSSASQASRELHTPALTLSTPPDTNRNDLTSISSSTMHKPATRLDQPEPVPQQKAHKGNTNFATIQQLSNPGHIDRSSLLGNPFHLGDLVEVSNKKTGGVSLEYAKARLEAIAAELLQLANSL